MRLLSLDLSLNTGYAIFVEGKLKAFDVIQADREGKQDHPNYPANFINAAEKISNLINLIIVNRNIDTVIVEDSVQMSRDRFAQKQSEFIHYAVNKVLIEKKVKRHYLSPSQWRKILEIKMTKEDKAHNKLVRSKKVKGKITTKHLTVRYINKVYGYNLLIKDNDKADAIGIGRALLFSKGLLNEPM